MSAMRRNAWMAAGIVAVGLGIIGVVLPLMPTVPFLLLAAFCFARGNPVWEQKLLDHPRYGPSLKEWRARGAIARRGKIAATIAFACSIAMGFYFLPYPRNMIAPTIALISLSWIWTRPD